MKRQSPGESTELLYLIATPIGNLEEFSPRAQRIIREADLIACEDTRQTAKLLSFFKIRKPLISLREHNEMTQSLGLVRRIKAGEKIVYMSDAGCPAISDPGERLVEVCLANDIAVTTVSGPSACLNALIASGLSTKHFYFHGFLDAREKIRREELRTLYKREETLIFYEAPHRIGKTLQDLYDIFGDRKACLARELTKIHEEYIRGGLKDLATLDPATIRGEIVLIIEGHAPGIMPTLDNDEIVRLVREKTEVGMTARDAIHDVALKKGVPPNRVYKAYHEENN